ncbi:MAG: sensor histidine kinase, partial [Nocardioides sp.]
VAICTAVATVLVTFDTHMTPVSAQVTQVFGVVAAALFLGAGVLRISRWRLAGDGRSLMMGAALVVLGGLVLPLSSLAGVIMGDSQTSLLRSTTAMTTTLVTLALVVRALNAPLVDAPLRPLRIVLGAVGAATLAFVTLVAVHVWAPELLSSAVVPQPMIRGSLLSIAWFVVGLEAAMRGSQLPWAGRVAPLMGCMAVSELLRVIGAVQPGAWEVTGAALVAVVASLTAHRALLDLDEATRAERANLEVVFDALSSTREGATRQRAWREDLVHDATNALAGLRAALVTLDQYGARLDDSTKQRLRDAALGEVHHLEHLMLRGDRDPSVDFDLEPVLRTVVETRRALGMEIDLHDCALRAHGRPGDLATVVQNLLVNADQHASGPVTIRAMQMGDRIEVCVTDSGPGMPASQVATLFQRGARGPESGGSGLGLHVAHSLMQQQGGNLALLDHVDGCAFSISLCSAGATESAPAPYQRRVRQAWSRPATAAAHGE